MAEPRYPTTEEFWRRLEERGVEADLVEAFRRRVSTEPASPTRLPAATVLAVAARLLPGAVPAAALAAFLDERHDQQLGRGDDRVGLLPRGELIATGFAVLDAAARTHYGPTFAELTAGQQDALLAQAEQGGLEGPDGFDATTWFRRTRGLLLLAYGSDPRAMVEMGFPGPSYRPGHVWLDEGEVAARARRRRGYRVL